MLAVVMPKKTTEETEKEAIYAKVLTADMDLVRQYAAEDDRSVSQAIARIIHEWADTRRPATPAKSPRR